MVTGKQANAAPSKAAAGYINQSLGSFGMLASLGVSGNGTTAPSGISRSKSTPDLGASGKETMLIHVKGRRKLKSRLVNISIKSLNLVRYYYLNELRYDREIVLC